ncbi:enoyl-CoA hydratase/isomerase family protein [Aquicella lusitana]|uniref:Enoyl-CoA hydratase n=1 Tax=Aquicella lusitana TaxID=254246 RepID=A0A370GNJ4_9COXI|nr:enoyl-CoA hydratase-related protein [Aquicella lusitana]RDI44846.1 enoyl-CoA hydratase [Aquicella lusitana]VVC73043.1 1,2-epoxyphenylacetyl-CoA isomerase [Aquicella lusitana]
MSDTLLFSVNDHIARITFNRPAVMNSFDKQMADELESITEEVRANPDIRAVLLNGAGQLFMAGGDLQFFHERLNTMPAGVMKIVRTLNASIINLMHMPKPVVASVHGSVAGVGVSLMMACDLAIAAEKTKFTLAYTGIGISPDGGASFNLPRLVGVKKAMEWLLLSDIFDAHTAQAYGLINWVVPADKLTEETERLLKRLANGPTQSYARVKRLINESWQFDLEKQLEREGRAFEACSITSDFKIGVNGFLNKNKPEFTGK